MEVELRGSKPLILSSTVTICLLTIVNGRRLICLIFGLVQGSAPMLEVPSIGCGGFVDDLGGVITMVNMSSPTTAKLYDCIWLVRPLMSFQQKSHLLVRLVQFSNTGTAVFIFFLRTST
jgi:hypothetical protein